VLRMRRWGQPARWQGLQQLLPPTPISRTPPLTPARLQAQQQLPQVNSSGHVLIPMTTASIGPSTAAKQGKHSKPGGAHDPSVPVSGRGAREGVRGGWG